MPHNCHNLLLSSAQIIATYRSVGCASFRVALSSASIGNVDEGFIGKEIEESKENMLFHAAAFSGLPIAAGVVILAGGKARPFKAIVR